MVMIAGAPGFKRGATAQRMRAASGGSRFMSQVRRSNGTLQFGAFRLRQCYGGQVREGLGAAPQVGHVGEPCYSRSSSAGSTATTSAAISGQASAHPPGADPRSSNPRSLRHGNLERGHRLPKFELRPG